MKDMDNNHHPADRRHFRSGTDQDCSTMSVESYPFSRTGSELSSYSDSFDTISNQGDLSPLQWPMTKIMERTTAVSNRLQRMKHQPEAVDDEEAYRADLDMMKERLSKLLLGEDMSGGKKGVCTALAISNAITNLYATIFGQFKRLEPLSPEKKLMWKKEIDCLLSVCNYMVEITPISLTQPDGTVIQVMESNPRPDITMNLPALRKLDVMLVDILDSFYDQEFWYVEGQKVSQKVGGMRPRNEEKWWLPVPCVPRGGLSERTRKRLQQKRKCADQIHKAARAINTGILTEMEIPESFIASLPKCARSSIGDTVYKYMSTADPFSPDYLLNHLDMKSEHEALDVADRLEAAMYVWKQKAATQSTKSSWVKMTDADKNVTLSSRADTLLFCLKQRYPEMSQTTLDTSKIQYNTNVGQAILESYSRVLESLAYNVLARIDDVLHADSGRYSEFQI